MKPRIFQKCLQEKLNKFVPINRIYEWEKQGLLGEIPRTPKKQRNYSQKNLNRAIIVTLLRDRDVKIPEIKELFSKDREIIKIALNTLLNDYKSSSIVTLEEIIGKIEEIF